MFEIEELKKSVKAREAFFTELYKKTFPAIAKYVSKRSGTIEEAKDIFQDAVIIYYEKLLSRDFSVSTSEKGYIMGISKYLWQKKFRDRTRSVIFDDSLVDDLIDNSEELYCDSRIMEFLETAGKRCLEMLKSFYYDKLSMEELAATFKFGSVRSATVQKYKCLEK